MVHRLLAAGHEVWGLARSDQSEFMKANPAFRASRCDVAQWSEVARFAAQLNSAWGNVDAIITAAGIQGAIGPAMGLSPEEWSHTVRSNLDGTFFVIRGLFDRLSQAQNRSKVICFSGGGSTSPRPNFSAYGVAKTGVVRLVETLAVEWQGKTVDINSVAPGAIYTRLTEEVLKLGPSVVGDKEYQSALQQNPNTDEALSKVGALVDYLLSTESDGITGRLLSAPWDPWKNLAAHQNSLVNSDVYTLRRVLPNERNLAFE